MRKSVISYPGKRREENQLDATECFIAHIICSTCFGHLRVHHQELETIFVLLPHMVCNALVADGRLLGAEQQQPRHYTPYAAVVVGALSLFAYFVVQHGRIFLSHRPLVQLFSLQL